MLFACNGKEIGPNDERIILLNPSYDGDVRGVFETMRTYDGEIFRLDDHLQRLARSAKIINLKLPQMIKTIKKWLLEALQRCNFEPVRIKLVVTKKDVLIEYQPLEIDPSIYEGVKVITIPLERRTPEAKTLDYSDNYKAHEKAVEQGCYDALLVDAHGNVKESAYANLFWVKNGKLYTCDKGVLRGITRQIILENTQCEFREISLQNLLQADEVFLTQTTREIIPVIRVNDVVIGNGTVGSVTQETKRRFAKWRDAYVERKS